MRSLRTKIFIPLAALIILTGVVAGVATYQFLYSQIGMISGKMANSLVIHAAKSVDPQTFLTLRTRILKDPGNEALRDEILADPDYRAIRSRLSEIKAFFGLKYLYTATLDTQGRIVYIVDGFPLDETSEEFSNPGDIEKENYPDLIRTYRTGIPYYGEFTTNDAWGSLISAYAPIKTGDGTIIGVVGADMDATDTVSSLKKLKWTTFGAVLFMLISAMALTFTILRVSLVNLKKLGTAVQSIQTGNLEITIPAHTRDEIGSLGSAFQEMLTDLKATINSSLSISSHAGDTAGDLKEEASTLRKSIGGIRSSAEIVTRESAETTRASTETARVMEDLASGISELSVTISQVSDNSAASLQRAIEGRRSIELSIEQMQSIDTTVEKSVSLINLLHKESEEIEKFVATITDISGRTNLLALNASIEAARAGEQGRGFAIVADEINKLADQSSLSAKQVTGLIAKIRDSVSEAVQSMQIVDREVSGGTEVIAKARIAFEGIIQTAESLNQSLRQLTTTSGEMSAGVEEVTASTDNMNTSMGSIREGIGSVEESLNDQMITIVHMETMAASLSELSDELRKGLGKYSQ